MNINDPDITLKPSPRKGTMPAMFLGHGSPMNAIDDNEFTDAWRSIGKTIPKPVAILCISAHWETRGTFVTMMENPVTLHDFGGFPKELYEIRYPAPGCPELANEIKTGIGRTIVDFSEKGGFDHGCWSVIRHLYPAADIPVVQMSLDFGQLPAFHYELGRELSFLRQKEVLIIGSCNMVHNLQLLDWNRLDTSESGYDWAREANEKLKNSILNNDLPVLLDYKLQGKAIHLSIPTPDHYLPLLYVLALKEDREKRTFFNDKIVAGSLSMTSFMIGSEVNSAV